MRRSWLHVASGFVLGFVGILLLMLAGVTVRLRASLPDDLRALDGWRSPPSELLDRGGERVATFSLVEPLPDPAPPPPLLAEAFFAAAPGAFYEPRVASASNSLGAMLRLLRGQPAAASPLSLALARATLAGEPPGPRRQTREELLATSLDGRATVRERVEAWLRWLPLCRGRRGLVRARRDCLGASVGPWTDAEVAAVAAAAAWGLDLAGDASLLAARRDAVLEQLVRRGLVDPGSARLPPPALPPPPASDACLPELLAPVRRALGASPSAPLHLHSGIDGPLLAVLRASVTDGLLVDPVTGAVRACVGAADPETRRMATSARIVAAGGEAPGLRWLPGAPAEPAPLPGDRLEAWNARWSMEERSGLRYRLDGDRLEIVHPAVAGALLLRLPPEAVITDLVAALPSARALLPDDLEVVAGPAGPRVRPRGGA